MKKRPITDRDIIGHKAVVDYLRRVSEQPQQRAHSYIFSGPAHVGKTTVAEWFINTMLCDDRCQIDLDKKSEQSYPDFYYLEPEEGKKDISVKQSRELISKLSMSSLSNNYRIAVIADANRLNRSSANALLKLIEEPGSKTMLFMLTNDESQILETIRSRSVLIRFAPVKATEIEDALAKREPQRPKGEIEEISRLALGRPGLAIHYLHNQPDFDTIRTDATECLSVLTLPLSERMRYAQSATDDTSSIERLQLILRDVLAQQHNMPQRVIHHSLSEQLKYAALRLAPQKVCGAISRLQAYEEERKFNVNTTLFLENILIELCPEQ